MGAMSGVPVTFRVTYARYGELRDDIDHQMVRGGLLVKVHDAPELGFDSAVALELVMPDGTTLYTSGKVLQVFSGFGIAVSVDAQVVEEIGRMVIKPDVAGSGPARHERVDIGRPRIRASTARPHAPTRPPALGTGTSQSISVAGSPRGTGTSPPLAAGSSPAMAPPSTPLAGRSSPAITLPSAGRSSPAITPPPAAAGESPREGQSRMEKVQLALHGTRDERNAILRDRDRTLYSFVLKNPQLDADDVVAIAKNPQMNAELLQQIGDRKDWLQRPAVALALVRNPKTPSALAVRALEHVPIEALRQMAKGAGVPPHVTQAARKKLLG
jgi:hypothetical protein